jgi:predicted secreted hydrolase
MPARGRAADLLTEKRRSACRVTAAGTRSVAARGGREARGYSPAYERGLTVVGSLRLIVVAVLALALGGGASVLGARPREQPDVATVVLPGDHGAHPAFQVEWWYTAGTASDRREREYFWFATVWLASGGAVARVNVVDLARDRVVLAREYSTRERPASGASDLGVRNFRLRWRRDGALGWWSVNAAAGDRRLDLRLVPRRPYILHGRHGVIQQGPGGHSAYYSQPRLSARGLLNIGRRPFRVRGRGWFDHQWGNFVGTPAALRWDWFACQFRDGRNLMLYQFFDPRDRPVARYRQGTLQDRANEVTHLRRFSASPRPPFVRPRGARATYPLGWRLRVPRARLAVTLKSRARHQFIRNRFVPSFREGAATITRGPKATCIVENSREVPAQPPG